MSTLVEEIFKGGAEGIFTGLRSIISLWKTDPAVTAANSIRILEIETALQQAQAQADLQLQLAQTRIDEIEAASQDKYVARWRPTVGWACCAGLVYAVLGEPLLAWASLNFGWKVPPPLDTSTLTSLLFGMLGFGTLRSFEKFKGVAK